MGVHIGGKGKLKITRHGQCAPNQEMMHEFLKEWIASLFVPT
jgi:hypothetical protein